MKRLVITVFISLFVLTWADIAPIVNGGVYKIQNDGDESVLSANDNGIVKKVLGKVKSDAWRNTDEQKWVVRNSPAGDSTIVLKTLSSRKNANNNVSLQLAAPGSTATFQYWEIKKISGAGAKYQIKSQPDGLCLQNMGQGKDVETKTCSSTKRSQRWVFLICNSLRCSDGRR